MSRDEMDHDDAFANGIAARLRAPERAPHDFESRVMADVRAVRAQVAATPRRAWLLRPRAFIMTPASALALAAGFALLVFGGVSALQSPRQPLAPTAAAADTLHVVRFVLTDSQASSISLVGAFNQWEKTATPMREIAPGVWSVQVPLEPGRHEYAFVVRDASGERWVADPLSVSARDEFGAESSVIDLRPVSTS